MKAQQHYKTEPDKCMGGQVEPTRAIRAGGYKWDNDLQNQPRINHRSKQMKEK